jgi:Subtilase family
MGTAILPHRMARHFGQRLLGLLFLVGVLQASSPAFDLHWGTRSNRVDARIHGIPLSRVLPRLARQTGWEIRVESGMDRSVLTDFTNLPPRDALRQILGELSFVLVPEKSKPSRLLVYQSSADAADLVVNPADDDYSIEPGPIPTELIVRIKPGSKLQIEELARKWNAQVVSRLDALGAYRLRFPTAEAAETALTALKQRDDITGVEHNQLLPAPNDAGKPLANATANFSLKPKVVGATDMIVVAVIDTRVQTLPQKYEEFILGRRAVAEGAPTGDGTPTHGTVMAENILQGVALADQSGQGSPVRLLAVDIYGKDPLATTWSVAMGLYDASAHGATYFSLSLGGKQDSPMLDSVIASIKAQGGVVLAAAGNDGGTDAIYPAASGALGVTAVDRQGQPASYANTGSHAVLAGPSVTYADFNGTVWQATGTSGATAIVAGLAAGHAAANNLTPAQTTRWLMQNVAFRP